MKPNPPKRPLQFLRWFCREDYLEEIEGDLTEVFIKQFEYSPRKAELKFRWSVIKYFRPEFMKSFKKYYQPDSNDMYKNYLKVALRNLSRHRGFAFINVAGLTLGITCALFIYLIVSYELSYDRYHTKADRIYRVNKGMPGDADTGTPHGLTGVLRTEFPEMDVVGKIHKINPEEANLEINKELFRESNIFLVQPQVFKLLDFQWLQGVPESLAKPQQAAVTRSISEKYFQGDAMGKVFKLNNTTEFTITGIIADPPVNTDFPIKLALSYVTLEQWNPNLSDNLDAGSNSFSQTYFLLNENVDPATLEPRLKKMVEQHVDNEQQKHLAFSIQPLNDIHFNVGNFNQRLISKETIYTLRLIGIVVLIIACINFINLASAQAIRRAKEVGIRKTLGGTRNSLVLQFLCETFVITFTSVVFATVITSQLLGFSESLFNIPLSADALLQTNTLLFMGALVAGVTLLSGFYPAFILSGYRPATALKGTGTTGMKGLFVRKGLITFQFLISQVLIVSTIIVIRQTDHFLSKPLGFNKEAVVTIDLPHTQTAATLSTLRNSLAGHSEIKGVSFSLNTPSATINKWWSNLKHSSLHDYRSVEVKLMDSAYLNMFEIDKVAGTTVLPDQSGKSVVVNETLVKALGITDPEKALGEKIGYWDTEATIIGVVKDFQTVNLRYGIHPVLLTSTGYFAKGSVKIDMNHASEAIALIEKHWKEAFLGNYFSYAFLDDQLATFYKEEKKMSRLLVSFATIAISIGCIGLFGLIAFVVTQRAKEVSIRKILGATVGHLARLLSVDFMKLVLLAGLIACPIAWYFLDRWLQEFSNRILLLENWWAFPLSIFLAALFALLTVSTQTIKAALTNPVESLKTE